MEISEYRLRNGTIMMLGEDYGIKRKKYETDEEWGRKNSNDFKQGV